MFVIMRNVAYLQLNGSFECGIETVRIINNMILAERIAKRLKAEVISVEFLLRNKVWLLNKDSRFHFDRAIKCALDHVATWPEWKQNILDNSSTTKTPRQPVINGEQSDGW